MIPEPAASVAVWCVAATPLFRLFLAIGRVVTFMLEALNRLSRACGEEMIQVGAVAIEGDAPSHPNLGRCPIACQMVDAPAHLESSRMQVRRRGVALVARARLLLWRWGAAYQAKDAVMLHLADNVEGRCCCCFLCEGGLFLQVGCDLRAAQGTGPQAGDTTK